MPQDTLPVHLAYLTGEYPKVSHTFILREVEALRAQSVPILTCSIRRTPSGQHKGLAEKNSASNTFYVLAAARNPFTLLAAQRAALANPRRYFQALILAFKTRSPGLRALLWQMFYFVEACILAHKLKQENVTHLHNHFAGASATVAMLTSALSGIPFSYTLHGPADLFEAQRWRLDAKTARARFVACISHFCRSQAMLFSDPAHWHKLRIIHCGVDPEVYDRETALRAADAPMHFIFVGRLAAVKGLRVLMEAFEIARQRVPDLKLTLVGDGPERDALEKAAAPYGDAIQFTGYQSQAEVAQLLTEADAFVLPSFAEGVPVVLMEALASAKPVIATQVAGVPELISDGVNGFLVPPGDSETLAARMVDLAQDANLCQQMGETGRKKVVRDFNIRTEAARLLALFLEISEKGGVPARPNPKTEINP